MCVKEEEGKCVREKEKTKNTCHVTHTKIPNLERVCFSLPRCGKEGQFSFSLSSSRSISLSLSFHSSLLPFLHNSLFLFFFSFSFLIDGKHESSIFFSLLLVEFFDLFHSPVFLALSFKPILSTYNFPPHISLTPHPSPILPPSSTVA